MNLRRLPVMILVTAVLAWGLAAGAGAPVSSHGAEAGVLRLSWSAHPERIETCRERTAEELASRPAHMRQALECEGTAATYVLEVRVDGALLDRAVVLGSGVRNDRPIFLLRDYAVAPGTHQVRVTFTRREETEESEREEADGRDAPARESARSVAPFLELDAAVRFAPGEVALVTYRGDALVLLSP